MTKITAIIPTLNEEKNVANALQSVAFADEIIVIDSYSTDKTVEIAKSHNSKVIQRKFDDFSSQKNFAIKQAKNDWVFLLDADEIANENLQKEVIEKANKPEGFAGFFIYRRFYFKNKKLKYSGWRHDKVIRLFNKKYCSYNGKVHEKITANGKIGFLKNKIQHYSFKEITRYKNKLRFYASLQALELYEKDKIVTPYHIIIKPIARFLIQYFVKLGFLDGVYGFTICKLHSFGVYMRYKKLLDLRHKKSLKPTSNFVFESEELLYDISIVIVNYKSWKHLKPCLKALTSFNKLKFSYEIIVVDNFSNDGKFEEFKNKYSTVDFILNPSNNGFANGCNEGAKKSRGKHLLFLNPDTIANQDALLKMLNHSKENKETGIVSCLQKNSNGFYENIVRLFPNSLTLFGATRFIYKLLNYNQLSKRYNSVEELAFPDWVSGSVVFINRDWFQKVKGWNEDYWMYYEDVDLSKKIKNKGGNIVLLESTEIIHSHGGASRINFSTASLTKTEVIISRHIYIENHFYKPLRFALQMLVVLNTLISKILLSILGLLLFFIPKMKLQLYIAAKVFRYYVSSAQKKTWISSKSINYKLN